ncbi:MAG: avidin [Sphingomonas sp.]|nr:MAG: avidin [Sphingomonas sp.]
MTYLSPLSAALEGTGQSIDFSGKWVNELSSTMDVIQNGTVLTGTYFSAVSGGSSSTTGALQGSVDGALIAFVVHWNDFQASTAWVGHLDSGTGSIATLWQMTSASEPGAEWSSINAGADTFTRA